jgi:hypothetical protein
VLISYGSTTFDPNFKTETKREVFKIFHRPIPSVRPLRAAGMFDVGCSMFAGPPISAFQHVSMSAFSFVFQHFSISGLCFSDFSVSAFQYVSI